MTQWQQLLGRKKLWWPYSLSLSLLVSPQLQPSVSQHLSHEIRDHLLLQKSLLHWYLLIFYHRVPGAMVSSGSNAQAAVTRLEHHRVC